MTTREEFFSTQRCEAMYESMPLTEEVRVPVTRLEFESLLKRTADVHKLVVDDKLRSILAGYIHHIPSDEDMLKMSKVAQVLVKSVSNDITWIIDQECKKKAQKELTDKQAKEVALANQVKDNVTPINPA